MVSSKRFKQAVEAVDRDRFLTPAEAVEFGLVDEVFANREGEENSEN